MFEIRPIFSAMLQHKSRAVLIILQMALTLAIVANALFIINERLTFMQRDTGFAESDLFGFNVVVGKGDSNQMQQVEIDEQMIRAIPGVINAVGINQVPLSGSSSSRSWGLEPVVGGGDFISGLFMGDEQLLDTMGVELIAGRNFTADEIQYKRGNIDIAIVTASMANKMFGSTDVLGKIIYDEMHPVKIIGVIKTLRGTWPSFAHFDDNVIFPRVAAKNYNRYLVRAEAAARDEIMRQIEDKMLAVDSNRIITRLKSMTSDRAMLYRNDSAMIKILTTIVVLLLFVTVAGIFGLSAFSVNQRIKQIGTRRALGASKMDITRYFLVENALMAAIGITLGGVLALMLNYFLVNTYGVEQLSVLYITGTMFGVLVVSQLAVLVPAVKAAQVSPAIATR